GVVVPVLHAVGGRLQRALPAPSHTRRIRRVEPGSARGATAIRAEPAVAVPDGEPSGDDLRPRHGLSIALRRMAPRNLGLSPPGRSHRPALRRRVAPLGRLLRGLAPVRPAPRGSGGVATAAPLWTYPIGGTRE